VLVVDVSDRRPGVWAGHIVLQTRDTAVAARFYERIGMRPVEVGEHFAVLEMRGGTHLVILYDPEHVEPGAVGWDLMVEDLDAAHDEWQAEGLEVTVIVDGSPHRSFEVTDPDGHVLVVRDSHVVGPV
jgi:catechol 2,3-dioxygenase-like lactoylglutathione lyase family enzyme